MVIRLTVASLMLVGSAVLLWLVFVPLQAPVPTVAMQPEAVPYQLRDWEELHENALNISLYTFRDRNRNGQYDTGDLPMAAIVVEVIREGVDESVHRSSSNINGYANFLMRDGDPQSPVSVADSDYRFRVLPPPGWQVTSGNIEQRIHFRSLSGSTSGLVADKPPQWVGLAPSLQIEMSVLTSGVVAEAGDYDLQVVSPEATTVPFAVDEDGLITVPAYPGKWKVVVRQIASDWYFEQNIAVKNAPVVLMPIVLGQEQREPLPYLVVENFDWLDRSVLDKIPNGHLGLNWDYLLAVENQYYHGPGYVNVLASGSAVAYNSSGHPVTISAREGEVFDFVGGYFGVAWPKAHGETLDVVAWRGGEIVSKSTISLSYLGPVWLQADLYGIDRLVLSTRHYWQFVVDDLTFRASNK